MNPEKTNRYSRLIEHVFFAHYTPGAEQVPFERFELQEAARDLGIRLPKNLGDIVYSFRYRVPLPESIRHEAPEGKEWIIKPAGRSRYVFVLSASATITPREHLAVIKLPNATPGVIEKYALSDEQALLAKIRYNRLVDIFTGLTCYSLQNHLRTFVDHIGQVETDEIYIGVNKSGAHFVIPVQAKGANERIGTIQIQQDLAMCRSKFPTLIVLPLAAQFLSANAIAIFSFVETGGEILISEEKHYALVPPEELSEEELQSYRRASHAT
ncbi:MAG: endonuclease [Chloroflexi bacterium]|nr:endonuclease [Chloroflexota bacterium]